MIIRLKHTIFNMDNIEDISILQHNQICLYFRFLSGESENISIKSESEARQAIDKIFSSAQAGIMAVDIRDYQL